MSAVSAFVIGFMVMVFTTGGVLVLFRKSLHHLLTELCEEEHRARFWGQLYAATVLLTVGLAGMFFPPPLIGQIDSGAVVYSLLPMFRAGLVGLLLCLAVLALTMVKFISERDQRRTQQVAQK
jgi:TRAP-type C4-dicarboxylate transport system permease large subunit